MNRRVIATLGTLTVGGTVLSIVGLEGNQSVTVIVAGGAFAITVPLSSVRFVDCA